jgi:hypothetical protein
MRIIMEKDMRWYLMIHDDGSRPHQIRELPEEVIEACKIDKLIRKIFEIRSITLDGGCPECREPIEKHSI